MDDFLFPEMVVWRHVEAVTIRQAACLLTFTDPMKYGRNKILPNDAQAMAIAIEQAILLGRLPPFATWAFNCELGEKFVVQPDELSPDLNLSDESTIRVNDVAAWCESKGIDHCWQRQSKGDTTARIRSDYPAELQAAIEVFEAVSRRCSRQRWPQSPRCNHPMARGQQARTRCQRPRPHCHRCKLATVWRRSQTPGC